jgi:hypothetical protein
MDRTAESAASPLVPHRTALLVLSVAGLATFAAWQFTGVETFLDAIGGFCL